MKIAWGTFTKADRSSHRQIEISQQSDWVLFNRIAHFVEAGLQGSWIKRLDGLDQRYWMLRAGAGELTLHLEHYLGITLYPTDGAAANPESLALLEAAYGLLAAYEPPDAGETGSTADS